MDQVGLVKKDIGLIPIYLQKDLQHFSYLYMFSYDNIVYLSVGEPEPRAGPF